MRLIVVGDYILDRYHQCDPTGVASEGPMMSLRLLGSEDYDGGAAVVASHLAGVGASPTFITALTDGDESGAVVRRLGARGVNVLPLPQRRQLVTKHRYIADQTKLMKLDEGAAAPLDSQAIDELCATVLAASEGAAGVVFADFGYGLLTGPLLDRLLPLLRPRVPVITADVSGMQGSLLRFRDVDLLCPTEREVRQTLNDFASGINAVTSRLLGTTRARGALITLGKQGLVAFDQHKLAKAGESWERTLRGAYLPSLAGHVVDPLGCGDALLAIASASLAAGGSLHAAAYLGSFAAAVQAERMGNQPVTLDQLAARLNVALPAAVEQRLAS